ncbi:hypothetical protein [Aestuariivirga sp.]|uniref:hypothetical protein n=1 Tax=Aestuariivirga sp. TaxID=2650926 RepID=UPI0039E338C0
MKIVTEATHLPEDYDPLIGMVVLGDNIERALMDETSPLAALLSHAREQMIAAIHGLLSADFSSQNGISDARRWQADALRYRDTCNWLGQALDNRDRAEETAADDELDGESSVQELREQMNGTQRQQYPDA